MPRCPSLVPTSCPAQRTSTREGQVQWLDLLQRERPRRTRWARRVHTSPGRWRRGRNRTHGPAPDRRARHRDRAELEGRAGADRPDLVTVVASERDGLLRNDSRGTQRRAKRVKIWQRQRAPASGLPARDSLTRQNAASPRRIPPSSNGLPTPTSAMARSGGEADGSRRESIAATARCWPVAPGADYRRRVQRAQSSRALRPASRSPCSLLTTPPTCQDGGRGPQARPAGAGFARDRWSPCPLPARPDRAPFVGPAARHGRRRATRGSVRRYPSGQRGSPRRVASPRYPRWRPFVRRARGRLDAIGRERLALFRALIPEVDDGRRARLQ